MSHFTVMVIGDKPEDQLAPFNENTKVDRYVEYTREQLIAKGRKGIEDYKNGTYAEFLRDPQAYKNKHGGNPKHIEYLETEFPIKLTWSDDQVYENEVRWYETEDIGGNGEVYSTYNPKSKWDWYSLGGRWTGMLKLKQKGAPALVGRPGLMTDLAEDGTCDSAYKKDIVNLDSIKTFAVLKNGEWYERGEMGWWGCISNEMGEQHWDEKINELLADVSDETLISIYDCHI